MTVTSQPLMTTDHDERVVDAILYCTVCPGIREFFGHITNGKCDNCPVCGSDQTNLSEVC